MKRPDEQVDEIGIGQARFQMYSSTEREEHSFPTGSYRNQKMIIFKSEPSSNGPELLHQ